ncbi:MAG TPA: HAMP domain-containing histidine kinase [Clostridiales bacterium]|nr:HAMP domain-containing histidine kinase [Clostridiales bacterium]
MKLSNDSTKRLRFSRLSRRILIQYATALAGFAGGCIFLFFFAYNLYSHFSFQATDFVYILAQFYGEYIYLFNGIVIFAGWAVITYYFISKPLHYLDEVVDAAEQLTQSSNEPVKLSDALKSTQDELNLVREQALRSAIAAKEAEQRKNDLVVYLAHDLKTPLTSVIGYLTLLRDEPQLSQELRGKYTGIALEKAERLEMLINEFFDITRFNLTQLTLEPESVNLTRMLEQITFESTPILSEKALHWDLHIAPDVQILCDPDKLERVFDNLIRNAVNYSYRDTAILMDMKQLGGYVTVRVENRGRTIPPEKLNRIFEQFFRLDTSRSSSTGGAGLGLAIAKEIAELHGGTITAESANEQIAFTVTLPVDCHKIV